MSTATPLTTLETLLRAKKLDVTLTSTRPWLEGESRDERMARLAPTGWPSVDDALGGGFPRGECSEIVGPASSGRTAVMCALLAAAGARGEVMALIDTLDGFDPVSAAAMDLDLSRLLWVRGSMIRPTQPRSGQTGFGQTGFGQTGFGQTGFGQTGLGQPQLVQPRLGPGGFTQSRSDLLTRVVDRAIKAFGLVLQAGGFGIVVLDLADVPMAAVRRLPFTTWLRVQRLIEGRETVGLVLAQEPIARSARGVTMRLGRASGTIWSGVGDRARWCVGFAVHPRISSAHRIDRER